MNTEKILAHADLTACYFRALVDKGVPMVAAIQLTSSYVSSCQIVENSNQPPREPWQGPSA